MEGEIVNRVAVSGIITLNLEEFLYRGAIGLIDIKEQLFQGLILREKDFREFIRAHDWEQYRNMPVAVFCSTDAIVPTWAYMLVAAKLSGVAASVHFSREEQLKGQLLRKRILELDTEDFRDRMVVVKGCGDTAVDVDAYVAATQVLTPVVKSLMYGEPCSTVPLYKKKQD